MKIVIYVRKKTNYESLTYKTFSEQNFPFSLEKVTKLIKDWDFYFVVKYFKFRKILNDIAMSNWKKLKANFVYNWKDLFDYEDNTLFLFTDDDDFYNPDLLNLNDIFQYDCIYWKSAAFVSTVLTPEENLPSKPYFDFFQKRQLFGNNYGFTKKGLLKIKNPNFFETSKDANEILPQLKSKFISANLNLGNKTIGSLTSLMNIKNIFEIIQLHKRFFQINIKIPPIMNWSTDEINSTMELYNENKNRTCLL